MHLSFEMLCFSWFGCPGRDSSLLLLSRSLIWRRTPSVQSVRSRSPLPERVTSLTFQLLVFLCEHLLCSSVNEHPVNQLFYPNQLRTTVHASTTAGCKNGIQSSHFQHRSLRSGGQMYRKPQRNLGLHVNRYYKFFWPRLSHTARLRLNRAMVDLLIVSKSTCS